MVHLECLCEFLYTFSCPLEARRRSNKAAAIAKKEEQTNLPLWQSSDSRGQQKI